MSNDDALKSLMAYESYFSRFNNFRLTVASINKEPQCRNDFIELKTV